MSEKREKTPTKNRIVRPRTELRWPPFHSNLLTEEFLSKVKEVFDEMLDRLYYGADKRKGWAAAEPWKEMTVNECRTCIRESIGNGKLIDAMNYIMFAYLNGHTLMNRRNPSPEEPVSVDSQMRDQLATALGVTGCSWESMLLVVRRATETVGRLDSISETLKTAYAKEKLVEKIARELKLDPEATEESILSTIHLMITTRQAELKFVNLPPSEADIPDPRNIRLSFELTEEQQKQIAETLKRTRIQINNAIAKWPRMTPPGSADESKKTALPNAISAPYGVKPTKKRKGFELSLEVDNSGCTTPQFIFRSEKDRDDYLPLLRTFLGALEQAAYGKGRVRHANDLPFIEQPILAMAHMLNSDAGLAQQVIKKTVEARTLPTKAARISELRGTLVYAAAMILFEEMYGRADDPDELDGDF